MSERRSSPVITHSRSGSGAEPLLEFGADPGQQEANGGFPTEHAWFGVKQVIFRGLQKIVKIDDDEMEPVMNGSGCYFLCLTGFFVMQPLRDDTAVSLGTSSLPLLFILSLVVTAVVSPSLSSYIMAHTPRKSGKAVRYVFRVMAAVTLGFYVVNMVGEFLERRSKVVVELTIHESGSGSLLPHEHHGLSEARREEDMRFRSSTDFAWKSAFYVWVNLQNVLASSTMWSRLADTFSSDSASRLFGIVGAGATLGQLAASAVAISWASVVRHYAPPGLSRLLMTQLLLVSALSIEAAGSLLAKVAGHHTSTRHGDSVVRPLRFESRLEDHEKRRPTNSSGLLSGLKLICTSSYLCHLCLYLLMGSFVTSLFYFTKTVVVARSSMVDSSSRTAWFAGVNFTSAFMVFILQVTASGRVLHGLGIATSLAFTPVITGILMATVAVWPAPSTVAVAEVLRKLSTYVISRVAREVLFTVVSREEKYRAKVIIDTVMLRLGDTAAAGVFSLLDNGMALSPSLVAAIGSSITSLWAVAAFTLGMRQRAMARKEGTLLSSSGLKGMLSV